MQVTIQFNDIYGGSDHIRVETLDVPAPDSTSTGAIEDWFCDDVFPHTGDGNAADDDTASYEVKVIACADYPALVGREYSWG